MQISKYFRLKLEKKTHINSIKLNKNHFFFNSSIGYATIHPNIRSRRINNMEEKIDFT